MLGDPRLASQQCVIGTINPSAASGAVAMAVLACRLWTCQERPANDYYSFTNFAHKCNSSENIRVPLLSDSRWASVSTGVVGAKADARASSGLCVCVCEYVCARLCCLGAYVMKSGGEHELMLLA